MFAWSRKYKRKVEKLKRYTTKECAKATGVSVRTIQNYIKKGKLSANRDINDLYLIDISEIERVFPEANLTAGDESIPQSNKQSTHEEIMISNMKITHLEDKIRILEDQLSKSEAREEKLNDHFEKVTKLIEYKTKKRRRFLFF